MIVRTVCDEGIFDKQHEYYKIFREQISFKDESNRQVFYVDLKTHFEDHENIDSIAVYDWLLISGSIPYKNGFRGVTCNIITAEQQNEVSEDRAANFIRNARFIGDTVIFQTVNNNHRLLI